MRPSLQDSYKNPVLFVTQLCARHVMLCILLDPPICMLCAFQLVQIGLITVTLEFPFRQLEPAHIVPIAAPWAVMLFATYRRRWESLQVLVCMREEVLRHDESTVDDDE